MFFFTSLYLTSRTLSFSNAFCLTLSPCLHLLSFLCPLSLPSFSHSLSPSLHEGLGRASLIGSAWWWRQSDLEWVTDEGHSACCLSSTAAAAATTFIYIVQPVEPVHSYDYQHTTCTVCTHKHKQYTNQSIRTVYHIYPLHSRAGYTLQDMHTHTKYPKIKKMFVV